MIPHDLYFLEKAWLSRDLTSGILYGTRKKPGLPSVRAHFVCLVILEIVIILSFKCMTALFNQIYRRGGPINRGLISYTVIMFSLVTVATAMQLNFQSISYIDNRVFPGRGAFPPWTAWVPIASLPEGVQRYPRCRVCLDQLVG